MFQLGGSWCLQSIGLLRLAPCATCRLVVKGSVRSASSSVEGAAVGVLAAQEKSKEVPSDEQQEKTIDAPISSSGPPISQRLHIRRSSVVAAAFAALKRDQFSFSKPKRPSLNDQIQKAETVESLLSLGEATFLSRSHALKIVSILADWTASNKVKLSDFDSDARFHKLCRLLGKSSGNQGRLGIESSVVSDLGTVLGVTGDDQAAKLISGMTLDQMIRVSIFCCG